MFFLYYPATWLQPVAREARCLTGLSCGCEPHAGLRTNSNICF